MQTPDLLHDHPTLATPLLGRAAELAAALAFLDQGGHTRWLTLLGPGGVGKTRLAAEVAAHLAPSLAGGVRWLDLAALPSTDFLPGALARACGQSDASVLDAAGLAERLAGRGALLVLDNFEHLPAAAPFVAQLLAASPELRVLATSRQPLGVRLEQRLALEPLEAGGDPSRSPAVQLYLQRAAAVGAPPPIPPELDDVRRLCQRLDGLPLALELAAARAGQLNAAALLARLDQGLALPAGGAADRPKRHHSLQACVSASHDLLDGAHQAVWRRLALLDGPWDEPAAAAVADTLALGLDTLSAVLQLADLGLVRPLGGGHFEMLHTIRDFGLAELRAHGEWTATQIRRAVHLLSLAERQAPRLRDPDQVSVLGILDAEVRQVGSALTWALGEGPPGPDPAAVALGIRLVGWWWTVWVTRGHLTEGWHWTRAALDQLSQLHMPSSVQPTDALQVLRGACVLARLRGDPAASTYGEQALAFARPLADPTLLAATLSNLAAAYARQADSARARALWEEALALRRAANDEVGLADTLHNLGTLCLNLRDDAQAELYFQQSLELKRPLDDPRGLADTLSTLAIVQGRAGQYDRAEALLRESLTLRRRLADRLGLAESFNNLGVVLDTRGQHGPAADAYRESLALRRDLGDARGLAQVLLNLNESLLASGAHAAALACLAEAEGVIRRAPDWSAALSWELATELLRGLAEAARQLGAWSAVAALLAGVHALTKREGLSEVSAEVFQALDTDAMLGTARTVLGDGPFEVAWQHGQTAPLHALLSGVWAQLAEAGAEPPATEQPTTTPRPNDSHAETRASPPALEALSGRELDVLRLLSKGWPNKKIAQALDISSNTVKNHLASVFSKLGVRTRAEAVAHALNHQRPLE